MRIPVVDKQKRPLMPCSPAKARILLKRGKARPMRNKLGIFYVQLNNQQEPTNQQLVIGIDPGSKYEGFSAIGTQDTVVNIMAQAPTHVKVAMETRQRMRRARRFRRWRRPRRNQNRLRRQRRLPPSTRSRWQAKLRIMSHLLQIMPLTDVAVEDVHVKTKTGQKKWNKSFSPVQMGKEYLYTQLRQLGLRLHLIEAWRTKQLREDYGLRKTQSKSRQCFESHCVDAWVIAASISGAKAPSWTRLWYIVPARLHRRHLHTLQPAKGGIRSPYGGTRSFGIKRGTLVIHRKYGRCVVGGCSLKKRRISLHSYRTNKRLTQDAQVKDCRILTWIAFRSWLV